MGYKEVRDALQAVISANLVAVTGTSYTLHERAPENLLDAQGYSFKVNPPNSSFSAGPVSTSQVGENQTWTIDIFSPNAGTSYRSEHEDRLLEYAEKLVTVFTNRRIITTDGVQGVRITGGRFNDSDYPVTANSVKYHYELTIVIEYIRARNC